MKKLFLLLPAMVITQFVHAQAGLMVGDHAPNFEAKNQYGKRINLNSTLKRSKVVIVFYRGFWCPNCSLEIKRLQDSLMLLTDKGVSVIAISPEGAEGVAKTVRNSKATFSVISDKGLKISKAYNVVFKVSADMEAVHKKYNIDVAGNNGSNGNYLPHPAAFIVGKDGKIIYRYYNALPYSDPGSNNRVTVMELLNNL